MVSEEEYQGLLKRHLLTVAPAYFLFIFLFLLSWELGTGNVIPSFKILWMGSFILPKAISLALAWASFVLAFACLLISFFLGLAAFVGGIRRWNLARHTIGILTMVFAPVGLVAFVAGWLQGMASFPDQALSLYPAFFYIGFAWFVVLAFEPAHPLLARSRRLPVNLVTYVATRMAALKSKFK